MGHWKRELTATTIAVNVLILGIAVAWTWPQWWLQINYDRGIRSWLFVVELAAIGFAALLTFYLTRLARPGENKSLLWLLLACGFLYLSFDKTFQLHENARDRFFLPRGIGTHLPGIRPGDLVPLIYATLGVTLVAVLIRAFRFPRRETWWLYGSVVFAAVAVVFDIADLRSRHYMVLRRAQFTEKWLQTGSLVSLLVFLFRHNVDLLGGLLHGTDHARRL